MATTVVAGTQNKILATAFPGVVAGYALQVLNGHPILSRLNKVKKAWIGESIRVRLINDASSTAQSYTDFDEFDITEQEPMIAGDYEMGGYGATVAFAGMQLRKISPSNYSGLKDLLEIETKLQMLNIRDKMSDNLFAAANDAKGILSLSTITDATTTIAGVGGSSTWGGTTTSSGSMATQGKDDMMTMFNTLSQYASSLDGKANDGTDLICCTNTVAQYYWATLEPSMRYTPMGKGDVGLTLEFMGIPLTTDQHVASGVMYFLNLGHLELRVHSEADFTPSEPITPVDQDAFVKRIIWNGQLVCDGRRYQGKLNTLSA